MLATLQAIDGPMLAAGDLNEARSWDDTHPGEPWGEEFFTRIAHAGIIDVLHSHWKVERPTRDGYQLDHVLASHDVADRIPCPSVVSDAEHTPADHAPVRFEVVS